MKTSIQSMYLLIKEFPLILVFKIYFIISGILKSLIPIYVMDYIVSTYETYKDMLSSVNVNEVIIKVSIMFGILLILILIDSLLPIYTGYVDRNFSARIALKFYDKIGKIDYEFYENPDFLNDYVRSLEMGAHNILGSANHTFSLITILCQCTSVFVVLLTIHYAVILYVLGIGILYFLLRMIMTKYSNKYNKTRQQYMRQTWYSNRAFTLKDSTADIKTTDIDKILLDNNDIAYDNIIKCHDKYISKRSILSIIGDIMISLLYPGIVAILCLVTINDLKISSFATLTVAATTLSGFISSLAMTLGMIQDNIVEGKVALDFLKKQGVIESDQYKEFNEDFNSLDIRNINFSYDNKYQAINNVSMTINKGEKIAIVGINGAGKTTLVKLLLRLYDVNNGNILINNQDYKTLNAKSIRQKVGAVFQNIEVYAVSVAENVLLREVKTQEDIDLVNEALKFSGLYDYIYSLKDNINTVVTREFHKLGVVFSGGQTQKLAIARGYAQNYQLFILDEPSSALDPIAEAKVYDNMLELGKDKTMIFISHRLTTTVNADKIYLFENGSILEQGTHQELMDKNGQYKKMFESQAVKYLGGDYNEETFND